MAAPWLKELLRPGEDIRLDFIDDKQDKNMKTFSQMGIVTGRFGGWGNRGRWNKDRWNDWRGGNDTVGYSILDLQLCSLFCISFKQHLFKYGVKK